MEDQDRNSLEKDLQITEGLRLFYSVTTLCDPERTQDESGNRGPAVTTTISAAGTTEHSSVWGVS